MSPEVESQSFITVRPAVGTRKSPIGSRFANDLLRLPQLADHLPPRFHLVVRLLGLRTALVVEAADPARHVLHVHGPATGEVCAGAVGVLPHAFGARADGLDGIE